MTRPAASPLADELHDSLGAWGQLDAENGWVALHMCIAATRGGDLVYEIVTPQVDGRGPWETLLDVDHCPVELLPWLAQWVGVDPAGLVGLDEQAQRDFVRDAASWRRGTPAALVGAGRPTLTGSQLVALRERDGGAYKLTVITYEAQTPDPAATAKRFLSQKPAGLVMTYRVDPGWSIGEMEAAYTDDDLGDLEAAYATLGALESNLPDEEE